VRHSSIQLNYSKFIMLRSVLQRPPPPSTTPGRPLSHSAIHLTTPRPLKPSAGNTSPKLSSPAPFNTWAQVRSFPRSLRYTFYTGLALAATAETSFWANVIYAKWFAGEEDRENANALLWRFSEAVRGYRVRYLVNYTSHYSDGVWGL
jgi:hypothetical protein